MLVTANYTMNYIYIFNTTQKIQILTIEMYVGQIITNIEK